MDVNRRRERGNAEVAAGERAESDIDLMIVGEVSHRSVAHRLRAADERIGREINPCIFPVEEFRRRMAPGDHFLGNVIAMPKLSIMGREREPGELVSAEV